MASIVTKVLSSLRRTLGGDKVTQVKVDRSSNANLTCDLYLGPGDDSLPLPDDFSMAIPTKRSGVYSLVGFLDRKSNQIAKPGEKRIYSRDSDGLELSQIYLTDEGDIIVSNSNAQATISSDGNIMIFNKDGGGNPLGTFEIDTDGNIDLNGVVIDTSGNITGAADIEATGDVTANDCIASQLTGDVSLFGHQHPTAPDGPPSSPTPTPTP